MGKINLTPFKRVDNMQLTDSQSIRRIESYLYVLNEQLRYELTHIDEDNISGDGLQAAAFAPSALKQAINEQLSNQTIDISDNDTILTINRRLDNLTMLQRQDAQNISANTRDIQTRAAKTTVDALSTRLSGDETTIAGIQALLAQTASAAALAALEARVTQAEIDIDNDEALIVLKASQEDVDGLTDRVSQAEIDIDGANALIALKASQLDMEDVQGRLSQAEIDIDGANAAITLKASQADLNTLAGRVSQAEIDIDGAEAAIALKASQADVDGLTGRMRQAEIDIDGAEAAIALKASQTDVDGLTERVTQAEIDIDAAEGSITSVVSKTGINSLGQNETLYSKITQTANSISQEVSNKTSKAAIILTLNGGSGSNAKIQADTIDIDGIVNGLQSKSLDVGGLRVEGTANFLRWLYVEDYIHTDETLSAGVDIQINGSSLQQAITGIGTATESNGQITIPTTRFDGTAGPSINFNIAGTQTYQDAVSAAKASGRNQITPVLSGSSTVPENGGSAGNATEGWYYQAETSNSGSEAYDRKYSRYVYVPKYTVSEGTWSNGTKTFTKEATTGTPVNSRSVSLSLTQVQMVSTDPNKWTVTAYDGNSNTGASAVVDASSRYTAGVTAGKNAVTINKGTWSNGSISFTKSEGTANTKSVSLSLTATQLVSTDPNKWAVTVKDGNSNTGASITVDASSRYTAGYNAGYAAAPSGYTNVTTKIDTLEVTEASAGRYKIYVYASSNSGGSEISHATKTTYYTP